MHFNLVHLHLHIIRSLNTFSSLCSQIPKSVYVSGYIQLTITASDHRNSKSCSDSCRDCCCCSCSFCSRTLLQLTVTVTLTLTVKVPVTVTDTVSVPNQQQQQSQLPHRKQSQSAVSDPGHCFRSQ